MLTKKLKVKGLLEQVTEAQRKSSCIFYSLFNPLNAELNPTCCLLALLGAHHFIHISRIMVNLGAR
jgi:hypothetical protein